MRPNPKDWHAVAESRLTFVLGPEKGAAALASGLSAVGLESLRTARDLHRFAHHLIDSGGFASAVGGLLSVHAVMYGDDIDVSPTT